MALSNTIIQTGDLVRLSAGGPTLVVERVLDDEGEETAICAWFDKRRVLHTRRIRTGALSLVRSPP
jgi:uncharacterized protein YodC (DUF2158 family)